MKQINSERKITNPFFNLRVGTTDKKNLNIIYINLICYITPVEDKNITANVSLLRTRIKQFFNNIIKGTSDEYILTFDVPEDMRFFTGKKTIFTLQFMYKLKDGDVQSFFNYIQKIVGKSYDCEKGSLINIKRSRELKKIFTDCGFKVFKSKR